MRNENTIRETITKSRIDRYGRILVSRSDSARLSREWSIANGPVMNGGDTHRREMWVAAEVVRELKLKLPAS